MDEEASSSSSSSTSPENSEKYSPLSDLFTDQHWEFAGKGEHFKIELTDEEDFPTPTERVSEMLDTTGSGDHKGSGWSITNYIPFLRKKDPAPKEHKHTLLGEWRATAIAGNDITSSCLYTAGLCTVAAGKYAPVSLLLVVGALYLYRNVYSEVGNALPMNGGSYTVLLNTTSKLVGSFAACLTLISYIATAVVSAGTAMSYLHDGIWDGFPVFWGTIVILGLFALLNLLGLSESANVALIIFALHMDTLSILCVWAIVKIVPDWTLMRVNWEAPPIISAPVDIFYGYCAALLGVTGFETSANYIEEQKEGVFPKTLRNMWVAIAIFNPLTSFLSMGVLSLQEIIDNSDSLLVKMAQVCGGDGLAIFVSVDATLVLCGSVLTSYVGIGGLVRRMTLDRCLPSFLLAENPLTGTCYLIIIGFFLVTSSLYAITLGNVNILAGVYAVAFLAVMSLFAVGNMLLKYKRHSMPRNVHAMWIVVVVALCCTLSGLVGNIVKDVDILVYFLIYFGVTLAIVMSMFARVKLLKILLYFLSRTFLDRYIGKRLRKEVRKIRKQPVIFFTKDSNLEIMNKAILYTRDNELTERMIIVHIYENEESIPTDLAHKVDILDEMYPKLKIDLLLAKGRFTPKHVKKISERLHIPQNFMFITCPSERFPEKIAAFGGMRIITH